MAATNVRRNPDGVTRRVSGYLNGTYTAASVASTSDDGSVVIASGVMTISLGFAPRLFRIKNVTDRLIQEWHDGMNQGDYLEEVAAGDKTLETDDKIVVAVTNTGSAPVVTKPAYTVVVTFDSGIATDNDTVVWEAIG